MTDQYPRRIRLYGGRLVHAVTQAGDTACRQHAAERPDYELPADAPVTCRPCLRRMPSA